MALMRSETDSNFYKRFRRGLEIYVNDGFNSFFSTLPQN